MSYFTPPVYSTQSNFMGYTQFANYYGNSDASLTPSMCGIDWKSNANVISIRNSTDVNPLTNPQPYYYSGGTPQTTFNLDINSAFTYFFTYVVPTTKDEYEASSMQYDQIFEKYLIDFATKYIFMGNIDTVATALASGPTFNKDYATPYFYSAYNRNETGSNTLVTSTDPLFNYPAASTPVTIHKDGSDFIVNFTNFSTASASATAAFTAFKTYCSTIGNQNNSTFAAPLQTVLTNQYKTLYDLSITSAQNAALPLTCTISASSYQTVTIAKKDAPTSTTTYTILSPSATVYSIIRQANAVTYTPFDSFPNGNSTLYLTTSSDQQLATLGYLSYHLQRLHAFTNGFSVQGDFFEGGGPNLTHYPSYYPQFMEILSHFAQNTTNSFQGWVDNLPTDWVFASSTYAGTASPWQLGGPYHYVPPVAQVPGASFTNAGLADEYKTYLVQPCLGPTIAVGDDPMNGSLVYLVNRRIEHDRILSNFSVAVSGGNITGLTAGGSTPATIISNLFSSSVTADSSIYVGTELSNGTQRQTESSSISNYLTHWIGYYYMPWNMSAAIAYGGGGAAWGQFYGAPALDTDYAATLPVARYYADATEYGYNPTQTDFGVNLARDDFGCDHTAGVTMIIPRIPRYAFRDNFAGTLRLNYLFHWDSTTDGLYALNESDKLHQMVTTFCTSHIYPGRSASTQATHRWQRGLTIMQNQVNATATAFNTRLQTLTSQYNNAYTNYQNMTNLYLNWKPVQLNYTTEKVAARPQNILYWIVQLLINLLQELSNMAQAYSQIQSRIQGGISSNQWYANTLSNAGAACASTDTANQARFQGLSTSAQLVNSRLNQDSSQQKTEIQNLSSSITQLMTVESTLLQNFLSARSQTASAI